MIPPSPCCTQLDLAAKLEVTSYFITASDQINPDTTPQAACTLWLQHLRSRQITTRGSGGSTTAEITDFTWSPYPHIAAPSLIMT